MNPDASDRHKREFELFDQALTYPNGPERDAFLAKACAGDTSLQRRIAELLRQHNRPGAFLTGTPTPPSDLDSATVVTAPAPAPAPTPTTERPGGQIGRYRLLEQIGEGGMGIVYLAEQTEPVRRRVALKIIRLGMDTKEVVARFSVERQALAMMDHPNIARVFDAGATESGRPYFVMELVKGMPVTRYCDEHQLDTRQRLDLFLQVCAAIQHSHQKGIIHRDIKPSNVLVSVQDGQPLVKVIDFGIAKATGPWLTDETLFTAFQQIIGTPAYMSPEQAGLSGLDIDTRSDIYSLGVMLYELLTGKPPFDPKSLFSAGLDEMRRIIRDVDPPRPSTRLSTLEAGELSAVAGKRKVPPHRLGTLVRGDLDLIVMKALEKDRTRRYDSADAFAADVRRFLNQEPVSAAPPGWAYLTHKFIRRHRGKVFIGATMFLLLALGVATSTAFAISAERARRAANQEASRRAHVAQFLQEMLEAVRPARALGRDTVMLRDILDKTAARIGRELREQPDVEFDLRGTLGRTYEALGSYTNAEPMLRRALDLARQLHGPLHTNVAEAQLHLGIALARLGRYPEATEQLDASVRITRQLLGNDHPSTAAPLTWLGNISWFQGDYTNAETRLRTAVEIRQRAFGTNDLAALEAAINLATVHYQQGRLDAMEPVIVSASERLRATVGSEHPSTLAARNLLAILRQAQGRFTEAETLHTESLAIKRRILGQQHPFTLSSMDNLAVVLAFEGRHAEAESLCREALDGYEARMGPQHRNTLAMRSNLAEYLRNQGRYTAAESLFREVMAIQDRIMAPSEPLRLETRNGLAVLYLLRGEPAAAESLFREILALRPNASDPGDFARLETESNLANALLQQQKWTVAEPIARAALNGGRLARPAHWQTVVAESQLAGALLGLGRIEEASPLLIHATESLVRAEEQIPHIDRLRIGEAATRRASLHTLKNDPEAARRWKAEAEKRRPPTPR